MRKKGQNVPRCVLKWGFVSFQPKGCELIKENRIKQRARLRASPTQSTLQPRTTKSLRNTDNNDSIHFHRGLEGVVIPNIQTRMFHSMKNLSYMYLTDFHYISNYKLMFYNIL